MFNPDTIDWDKLKKEYKYFSVFYPTDNKLRFLADKLIHGYLNISDEDRIPEKVRGSLLYYFPPSDYPTVHFSLFYEVGDFDGILGFKNILPEFKCSLSLILWGGERLFKSMKGAELIKEGKDLINIIMDEFKLRRIESETPYKRMVELGKLLNFKVDGSQKYAFRWNGKLYTKFHLAITKDGK